MRRSPQSLVAHGIVRSFHRLRHLWCPRHGAMRPFLCAQRAKVSGRGDAEPYQAVPRMHRLFRRSPGCSLGRGSEPPQRAEHRHRCDAGNEAGADQCQYRQQHGVRTLVMHGVENCAGDQGEPRRRQSGGDDEFAH